jgi:DNA-binding LytR/AlgR family response regulator
MATILIVEDELLIAAEIERALTRMGHTPLEPVDNSEDALAVLGQHPVELVLMDINIEGDTDGIATALLVRRQFAVPVVFLTARSDAATLNRAKLAQPYGYLLKPFTEDGLRTQIELALYAAYQAPPVRPVPPPTPVEADTAAPPETGPASSYFFVKKGTGYVKLNIVDIHYLEALENYVRLHTATEQFVVYSTLKDFEAKLPANFFKTHRSHIVNLDHVRAYEEGCVLLGKIYVPVSRSCKEELKKRIHLLG